MPRCFENGNGDFGPEAFRAIHCAQLSTNGQAVSWFKTFHIHGFLVSDPRSIVLFFTKNRQFAAIDCDVFMCGSYRIAGSELPRGLGAYVRVLY